MTIPHDDAKAKEKPPRVPICPQCGAELAIYCNGHFECFKCEGRWLIEDIERREAEIRGEQ